MGSERTGPIADALASATDEAAAFALSCSAAQWELLVPGEEWTVGVVIHHVAEGHANMAGWLRAMTEGAGVTDTAKSIDAVNVEHAVRAAGVGQADTVALLRRNGAELESLLRALSDDDLDRKAPFGPAGGQEMPTEALAAVAARHVRGHLDHARRAVDAVTSE